MGVVLVNYYPKSKLQTAYISGMAVSHHYCTPEQAIDLALYPKGIRKLRNRNGAAGHKAQRARKRLYRHSQNCHWCHAFVSLELVTIDHVIPLSKGGLDHHNNMVLACSKCNRTRANDMPNEQFRQREEENNVNQNR